MYSNVWLQTVAHAQLKRLLASEQVRKKRVQSPHEIPRVFNQTLGLIKILDEVWLCLSFTRFVVVDPQPIRGAHGLGSPNGTH